MPSFAFQPGFRFSIFDAVVLLLGLSGAVILGWQLAWWAGFLVGFVLLHFFLFCNVFRISRASELTWAAGFLVLAGANLLTGSPGWIGTALGGLVLSAFLIGRETRQADYHGVGWQRWNPGLPDRWNTVPSADATDP